MLCPWRKTTKARKGLLWTRRRGKIETGHDVKWLLCRDAMMERVSADLSELGDTLAIFAYHLACSCQSRPPSGVQVSLLPLEEFIACCCFMPTNTSREVTTWRWWCYMALETWTYLLPVDDGFSSYLRKRNMSSPSSTSGAVSSTRRIPIYDLWFMTKTCCFL